MEGVKGSRFYEREDELTHTQVQAYFKMLKEVEWGYKGKAIVTSTPSPEGNSFYQLFLSQNNKEN
jgi:hypothetical protein